MKSVLRSVKPYWIYLILTGKKTVEVGKDFPKSAEWNKVVEMYCSKDMRSFNRIPEKDREWMRKYLGKVACRFVCDRIEEFHEWQLSPQGRFQEAEQKDLDNFLKESCLSYEEVCAYRKKLPYYKPLYSWQISDLKIYDKPKELSEFYVVDNEAVKQCEYRNKCYINPYLTNGGWLNGTYSCSYNGEHEFCTKCKVKPLTRPPQSWCYIEEV